MSRRGFYWLKCNNRYDSILDLIVVSQKEETDSVLLLDDYTNAIYIQEIFLTTAKLDLNKIFDRRTFHIMVIRIAKENIRRFLKFDEIIFWAFQCFQFRGLLQKLLIVVFLISLFLKAHLKLVF